MKLATSLALTALLCTGCFLTNADCQAEPSHEKSHSASLHGAVRLDGPPLHRPISPFYTLRYVQVGGTKPTQYFWFLEQSPAAGQEERIEPNDTVFAFLDAPVLRDFVSRLPPGTRILHSWINLTGPDPTMKVGSENEPGLQDFIKFCRSHKIDFVTGYSS